KRIKEIQTLKQTKKEMIFQIMDLLSQTRGTKVKGITVKILELNNADRKYISVGFNDFPKNTVLFVNLGQSRIMILSSSERIQANNLLQEFTDKLGGKGGGNPKVAQGIIKTESEDIKSKEIISIIQNFIE
ncbi:MAG: DHHA1 domain-containing protein, partial [Promethearchaeota archaeon]